MDYELLSVFSNTVKEDGDSIWVKPVCDFFGLDVQYQYRKIKADPVLAKISVKFSQENSEKDSDSDSVWTKMSNQTQEIDSHGRIFLTKKGFLRWIQIINPKSVKEELREKFIDYQTFIFDYMMGSFAALEASRRSYKRIAELKSEKAKIETEIRKEQEIVDSYVGSLFVQKELSFSHAD